MVAGSALDKEVILARLGGNKQLFETICNSFLKMLPGQLSVIGESVSNRDIETLSRSVHRLKGSVGYFDNGTVAGTILELQSLTRRPEFEEARARFLFERLANQLQDLIQGLESIRSSNSD